MAQSAAQEARIAQGRAQSAGQRRHEEMLKTTRANKPKPTFWEEFKPFLPLAAVLAYQGWKRRPSEVVVGYRRA